MHAVKQTTEVENNLTVKTHLTVSKKDTHVENKIKIKSDKTPEKHKIEKKSHKKTDKISTSENLDTQETAEKRTKEKSSHLGQEKKSEEIKIRITDKSKHVDKTEKHVKDEKSPKSVKTSHSSRTTQSDTKKQKKSDESKHLDKGEKSSFPTKAINEAEKIYVEEISTELASQEVKEENKELSLSKNLEKDVDTKEKVSRTRHKRAKEITQDKMKQSSSLDRIKQKDEDKHKHDTYRSKREKFAKRHSDDRLLNKNIEIDKDISRYGDKKLSEKEETEDLFANKKRFTKAKPPNILVYADSLETRENTKSVLRSVLNENK